jgi:hypothetical protein
MLTDSKRRVKLYRTSTPSPERKPIKFKTYVCFWAESCPAVASRHKIQSLAWHSLEKNESVISWGGIPAITRLKRGASIHASGESKTLTRSGNIGQHTQRSEELACGLRSLPMRLCLNFKAVDARSATSLINPSALTTIMRPGRFGRCCATNATRDSAYLWTSRNCSKLPPSISECSVSVQPEINGPLQYVTSRSEDGKQGWGNPGNGSVLDQTFNAYVPVDRELTRTYLPRTHRQTRTGGKARTALVLIGRRVSI